MTLNGLLLIALGLALRRCFSVGVALGTIVFLAIDPTVAAHLPVVMTDLPVALLAATAVVLATRAFRTWSWPDLAWCAIALGLALGAKHSAPIFCVFLGIAGVVLAIVVPSSTNADKRALRLAKVCAVLLSALVILWSFYFFRFHEGNSTQELFNRALANKITDVSSPGYRFVLSCVSKTHVVPRAYLWGFADTVHAGMEGRAFSQLAFGHPYYNKAPWYFFPGVIAVKLPVGLSLLALLGICLVVGRRCPREWELPAAIVMAAALFFLLVLSRGATYGGVRHALPVIVFLAILGGIASDVAWNSKRMPMKVFVGLAFLIAAVSALPVMRPWEYFNEIVGGAEKSYLYFDDDGTDLGQRGKDLARYYHEVVEPTGEIPFILFFMSPEERQARGIDWLGRDLKRDEPLMNSSTFRGTVIVSARSVSKKLWWDMPELRAATPVARVGSLMVFRGTFDLRAKTARALFSLAVTKVFADKPDLDTAERLLKESAAADPSAFRVYIELGNIYMQRGSRDQAQQAYASALEHAPPDPSERQAIENQLSLIGTGTELLDRIAPLRDPGLE